MKLSIMAVAQRELKAAVQGCYTSDKKADIYIGKLVSTPVI